MSARLSFRRARLLAIAAGALLALVDPSPAQEPGFRPDGKDADAYGHVEGYGELLALWEAMTSQLR
jgi:hypothetical protein